MAFELSDDGTMDTVVRCAECGAELRYNYDGGMDEGDDESQPDREQAALDAYDAFVEWAIEDAESEHECNPEPSEPEEGDITTEDHETFYQYGKLVLERMPGSWRIVSDRVSTWLMYDTEDYTTALRAYMERVQFWPNCWFISDHGNAHLMDLTEGK